MLRALLLTLVPLLWSLATQAQTHVRLRCNWRTVVRSICLLNRATVRYVRRAVSSKVKVAAPVPLFGRAVHSTRGRREFCNSGKTLLWPSRKKRTFRVLRRVDTCAQEWRPRLTQYHTSHFSSQ